MVNCIEKPFGFNHLDNSGSNNTGSNNTEECIKVKRIVLSLVTSLLCTPLLAAEKKLTTQQITELLSGSTIKGIHYGVETRQYFSESGLTLWIKSGDEKPSEARYKIENDQYCSSWTGLWNEEDYGCFNIAHDEEQNIYYFLGDDFRAPFVINSGFELNFD